MEVADGRIELSKLAPPGISGTLIIVAEFDRENVSPEHDVPRLDDKDERDFSVSCMFSKETGFSGSISGAVDATLGTSFFKPQPGHSDYAIQTPLGVFNLVTNAQSEFSGVTFRCRANTFQQARSAFHQGLVPFLDYISYVANVPIIIARVNYSDEKNKVQSFEFTTPYQEILINPTENTLHPEMLPVYALYREAKNTMSPLYRFLCYYKILEGIYNHLRPEIYRLAREHSVDLSSKKETIPDDREMHTNHNTLVGRPIKDFFDRELSDYRNDVAHYILDSGTFLSVTNPDVTDKYLGILWPAEQCCRIVIAEQESLYTQYCEALTKQ